jgi:uncharacterized protein (DUF58 family)
VERFVSTPEPGESGRNAFDRLFIYYRWRWLMEKVRSFTGGTSPVLASLRPGERARVPLTVVPQRRGVIRLADLRANLPDPFGLFQRCRWVVAPDDSLVVLPKRYRLPPLDLPGAACFQIGGEAVSNTIGLSGEFLGLRNYRSGDALRHIHWKSWAKTGQPIVKEFEDTYFPRYGLVLDNFVDPGDEDLFEESVSVAASFAATIDTKRSLLDLMFVREEAIVVSAGRGLARTEKVLEMLAAVEAEPVEKLESLLRLVRRHQADLTACICVFTGWTGARARFVRALARGGTELIVLVVCHSGEEGRRFLAEHPVPCRSIILEHGRVQKGLSAL